MRKSWIVMTLLGMLLVGGSGLTVYYLFWGSQPPKPITRDPIQDFARANELINSSKSEEALVIIQYYKPVMESLNEEGLKWIDLLIKASVETRAGQQLAALHEYYPEIYKNYEEASLLVADFYVENNRLKDFETIRTMWEGKETKEAAWFILDVDKLLAEGNRSKAIEKLKSQTFEGPYDVGRLVRLALISANDDSKAAWDYLNEAFQKDPNNPEIHSWRARLLESVGQFNSAHKEYRIAVRLNTENIFLKDQLAEFYLRQKKFSMALDVWKNFLEGNSLDTIWVKTLFWNKVTSPLEFNWKETTKPEGNYETLVEYLISLEPETFWDKATFENVLFGSQILKTRQETFWLRLIQELKMQREKEALDLLKYNPFANVSWYPELNTALMRILKYRQEGTLALEPPLAPIENPLGKYQKEINLTPFFQKLEDYSAKLELGEITQLPEDIHALLVSPEVFSATFLAAGWAEAGLQLHELPIIPETFPHWVAINIVKAMSQNRTTTDAIRFATIQKSNPELSFIIGELMAKEGDVNAALEKFEKLQSEDSDIGFRASWMASLIYIDKQDYVKAREFIESHPRLREDLLGKETLARIAFLEGNLELSDKLYAALENDSSEARSYLAKRAYDEKDWQRAFDLTKHLLQDYPDNPTLWKNLKQISDKVKKEQAFNDKEK